MLFVAIRGGACLGRRAMFALVLARGWAGRHVCPCLGACLGRRAMFASEIESIMARGSAGRHVYL